MCNKLDIENELDVYILYIPFENEIHILQFVRCPGDIL
jgi:hypothetical protein